MGKCGYFQFNFSFSIIKITMLFPRSWVKVGIFKVLILAS
jgi:hypothetical protein